MTVFDPRLIPPDDVNEGKLPFRPVWRTTAYETIALLVLAAVAFFGSGLLGFRVEAAVRPLSTAIMALVPLGVWVLFSWRAERNAINPRRGLVLLLFVSMLVANALVAPVIEEFIAPERWLNWMGGLSKIVAYALTVGITTEFAKYLILRYTVWQHFQQRLDSVAYSLVVSLAFATVFNLRFALLEGGAQPAAAAIRIVSVVLVQQAVGIVVSYRLMTLKLERSGIYVLAANLILSSVLHGVYAVARRGIVVGSFGIGATANSPLRGLIFSAVFAVILFAVFAFLISNDDARDIRRMELG